MKKTIIIIVTVMIFLVGCSDENQVENSKEIRDVKEISEVRKNVQTDLKNAKNKYSNLLFEDIKPYCTDMNEVYDISYEALDNYKGIADERDMYDEQMKLIKEYLGNDLEDKYFATGYCDMGEGEYSSFAEFKKDLFDGKQMDATWLAYNENDENNIKYAELQLTLGNVFFYKGVSYNSIPLEVKEKSEYQGATQPRFLCDTVKTYYVYKNDDLNDEYTLKNGSLSIQEGIDFMEDFLNEHLGIEGDSNIKLRVDSVEVIKLNEEYNCFRYNIVREIFGLKKIYRNNGTAIPDKNVVYDMSEAYMVSVDDADMYFGKTNRLNYVLSDKILKIISLDKALEIISDKIGKNSSYMVKDIRLGYLDKSSDSINGKMTACWVIGAKNKADNSMNEFYVNARNGEIEVYTDYNAD